MISPATTAAEQLPVTDSGRLACRVLVAWWQERFGWFGPLTNLTQPPLKQMILTLKFQESMLVFDYFFGGREV